MGLSRRSLLLAPALMAPALLWPRPAPSRPLWAGARYSEHERARAIQRGLTFVDQVAADAKYFSDNGDDLLWFYFTIAANAADRDLRARALRLGRERSRQWRKANPRVPADALTADLICSLVSGSYAVDQLGVPDREIEVQLRRAVTPFTAMDFLRFDPLAEPVPSDVPETCATCSHDNARGARVCSTCKSPLVMRSPYDVLCDALITTYTGERYGIVLGAHYADVTRWLPRMRPYPAGKSGTAAFDDVAYAVTHVIYTLNDYSAWRLRPQWLPDEFGFLKNNLKQLLKGNDAETLGEFLETLRSFGVTENDADMRAGVEFLLSRQNDDGSWGDRNSPSIYTRYHTTWTAMNGLMDYAWRGEGVSFPAALARARGA